MYRENGNSYKQYYNSRFIGKGREPGISQTR